MHALELSLQISLRTGTVSQDGGRKGIGEPPVLPIVGSSINCACPDGV